LFFNDREREFGFAGQGIEVPIIDAKTVWSFFLTRITGDE
jgi:hypothetical protein